MKYVFPEGPAALAAVENTLRQFGGKMALEHLEAKVDQRLHCDPFTVLNEQEVRGLKRPCDLRFELEGGVIRLATAKKI